MHQIIYSKNCHKMNITIKKQDGVAQTSLSCGGNENDHYAYGEQG